MSHKRYRTLWQHKFYLSSDDPQEKRLHDFLKDLAQDGEASVWMVESLYAAMPPEPTPLKTAPGRPAGKAASRQK